MKDGIGSALGSAGWHKLENKEGTQAPVNADARFASIKEAQAAIAANQKGGDAYLIVEDEQDKGTFVVLEKDVSQVKAENSAAFNPVAGATYFAATATNAGTHDAGFSAAANRTAFAQRFGQQDTVIAPGATGAGAALQDALPLQHAGKAATADDTRTFTGNPGGVMGLQMEINQALADAGSEDLIKTDGKFGAESLDGLKRALPTMLGGIADPERQVALLRLAYGDDWAANPAAQAALQQAVSRAKDLPKITQLVSVATQGGTKPLPEGLQKAVDDANLAYFKAPPLDMYGPGDSQMVLSHLIKTYGGEAKIPPDVRQAADAWSVAVIDRAKTLADLQKAQQPVFGEPVPARLSPTVQKAFDTKVGAFIDALPKANNGAAVLTQLLTMLYPSQIPDDILKKRDAYEARNKT